MFVERLKQFFKIFVYYLNRKLTLNKFELFLSPNYLQQKKSWFSGILQIKYKKKPSKYLRIKMGSLKHKRGFFQPLMDKINHKLAS